MATYIMHNFDPEDTPFNAVITKKTLEFEDLQKEIPNAVLEPRDRRIRLDFGDSAIVLAWINGRLIGYKYSVGFGVCMSVEDVTVTKDPAQAVATLRVRLPGDEPSAAPEVPLYDKTTKLIVDLNMRKSHPGCPPIPEMGISLKGLLDDDTPQPNIDDYKAIFKKNARQCEAESHIESEK